MAGFTWVEYARRLWKEVQTHLTTAAADTPEALFAYRPTSEVRSFGETPDHVAASQNGYCRMALGERPVGDANGTGAKTSITATSSPVFA